MGAARRPDPVNEDKRGPIADRPRAHQVKEKSMRLAVSRSYTPAALLAAALALAAPATASAGKWRHGGACAADVQNLCPDASGHDAIRQCLQQHKDDVSAECG